MKKLCLGTFINILCQAKKSTTKQSVLIYNLFMFLTTKQNYQETSLQGHLKSGKNNFVDIEEVKSFDKKLLVSNFKNNIIPYLNPNLFREIILAFRKVLSEDDIEDTSFALA